MFLVILGGLVPEVLARDDVPIPEHLGTTDVDVLLVTHADPDADLGGVERTLGRIGFRPDAGSHGWRWRGPVEGAAVALECLCDLPDQHEHEIVRPRGCTELAAANLPGAWGVCPGNRAMWSRQRLPLRIAAITDQAHAWFVRDGARAEIDLFPV